jgi:hypothetical protein
MGKTGIRLTEVISNSPAKGYDYRDDRADNDKSSRKDENCRVRRSVLVAKVMN